MQAMETVGKQAVRKAGAAALAALVAMALIIASAALPARAEAVQSTMAGTAAQLEIQAASYEKSAVKDAKAIIKKAGATSGPVAVKLKKIYAYIATNDSFGGTYSFENLPYFYSKYGQKYYSMLPSKIVGDSLLKKYYKKYAVDMYNDKKGACFHYASLFAVAAKQALGKSATVKIAAGASKHTGSKVDWHSWVEVKIGKKTYVYDPQAGNTTSKSAGSATAFGKFCGSQKSALKGNYYNYKGVKYVTVKL